MLNRFFFAILTTYAFYLATSPTSHILCIFAFQNSCCYITINSPKWLHFLLTILSNDIHQDPGPLANSFFTFVNWNVNSIAKDNFYRLKLLEAQTSIFNYDLISLCETSLNDTVDLPFLHDYIFISSNKPDNTRHGGVGLYYKNTLPIKVREDLSFDESIVVELNFGRKKIFFTVLYRSPAFSHTSAQFANFLSDVSYLYSKIKSENPYVTFFCRRFQCSFTAMVAEW